MVWEDCRLETENWNLWVFVRRSLPSLFRLPTGLIRVIWFGTDWIIDFKYLLASTSYVRWNTEPQFENLPNPSFIDWYGPQTSLLTLRHANENYAMRMLVDDPLVIVPQRETTNHSAQLRDDSNLFRGTDEPDEIESTDQPFSPRTPLYKPSNVEEDDDTNHSLHWIKVSPTRYFV